MQISCIFAALAVAIGVQAATVADVLSDINAIGTGLTKLDNDINAVPNSGSSFNDAFAIYTDVGIITSAIDKATTDCDNVTPLPVSESDAQSILSAVNVIKPTILSTLTRVVQKKAALTALPIGGMQAVIRSYLSNLNTASSAFETALIANAPSDLKASALDIQSSVDAAFATAIAAYSSA